MADREISDDSQLSRIDTVKPSDVEGIENARIFFSSFGLTTDNDGLLVGEFDDVDLGRLRKWRDDCFQGGNEIPTENIFYEKVLLAVSLWPQRDKEGINYLLGKGIGVEIALRGKVLGRKKNDIDIPFRPHSDFELYGVDERKIDQKSRSPLQYQFSRVFGGQEYFHWTNTKGLKGIREGVMHDTAEIVDLGGVHVLIPQLEILFLDKFLKKGTPRPEGFDDLMLARSYNLDRVKIHQYLDDYFILPEKNQLIAHSFDALENQLSGIRKGYKETDDSLKEDDMDVTKANRLAKLNQKIASWIELSARPGKISGIRTQLWIPIEVDQIDDDGNIIDLKYKQQVEKIIGQELAKDISKLQATHKEIDDLLDSAEGYESEPV